ncbi:thioredoxin family protein [Undibacterium oligocarboniphilum]|uniref:Thioredoxin family protein n=1 Tax=Undibacterium oligocarboniphilum TaxID=666702 RepID=A0A850QIU7_9BURK|nr:thioredoxin family protein [Undibacterium oligocarboniphilum]MBC3871222.1 thioredoxin family protein [Undibacterium oligocarboniphilum]NVO79198.1 thioredoxin family protein [Undibacterium oligocarboniphilum]
MSTYQYTDNLQLLKQDLSGKDWLVACLCAAWCDTCTAYRAPFQELAARHSDKCFAWIDIEESAHLIDEIDIENFPTLLIQYQDQVAFLGTMLPDIGQLHRLISSLQESLRSAPIKRSALNQQAPAGWNLRQLILAE